MLVWDGYAGWSQAGRQDWLVGGVQGRAVAVVQTQASKHTDRQHTLEWSAMSI